MSFDPFGGLFGGAIFGDVVFADINAINRGQIAAGIGGSGFPDNWFEIMLENQAQSERQRRRLQRELEEVQALVLAGLL